MQLATGLTWTCPEMFLSSCNQFKTSLLKNQLQLSCMWKPQLDMVKLNIVHTLGFLLVHKLPIQFRECWDITISGLHVISTWLKDYLLLISQNKFYKLWKNMGNGGKWYLLWHICSKASGYCLDQLGLVFDSLWAFLNLKSPDCLFLNPRQPDLFGNWIAI